MTGFSRRDLLKRTGGMAAAASLPAFVTSSGVADAQVPAGPSGVHVAYGRDPGSTARVGWSGPPATDARVEYAPAGETPRTTARAQPAPLPGERATAYSVTLTGLAPGTTYEYVAVQNGNTAGPFEFTTAPDAGDSFRATAVGDHGIADPDNPFQRPNTDDPQRVIQAAKALDTDLHVGVGDISYANGHPSTWELYFAELESFYAETPFMTIPGNHEAEPGTGLTQYDRRLNELMPVPRALEVESKPRWYDFQYGNTLFVGLNTTSDDCGQVGRSDEAVPIYDTRCRGNGQTYDEMQDAYVERTLKGASEDSSVDWIVVYFHGPMWTTSPDHAPRQDVGARWGPYFDEYGVDLVMSGDNHVYERTNTIVGEDVEEHGTTYVTNGTGGVSHYPLEPPERPEVWARRTADYFGVTQLDVDGERLRVRYHAAPDTQTANGDTISDDGEFGTVDDFTLVHDERGRTMQVESGTDHQFTQ